MAIVVLPFSLQAQQPDSSHIQSSGGDRPSAQLTFGQGEGGDADDKIDAELRGSTGLARIVIELDAPSTVQAFVQAQSGGVTLQATQAAQAQLARVEQGQQQLLAPLSRMGATVIYRTQQVYNGIGVHVDAGRLGEIARLPGVKGIHRLVKHYPDLESSVPLIGAPELWQGVSLPSPLTGTGLKVAIIDTGIDYLHTGFGGPGTQAAYDANDTTVLGDVPFPTAKVVAGYDFVGDDYTGDNAPQPDPDPMDCNGHGSHVAGIAAGNGVTSNGAAYAGPYNTGIYTTNFRIGPGVAPQASLIALRVFGCDGSTELVSEALEWAIDPNGDGDFSDRADVINMSLGSDFGFETDATSVAADNAVLAGTIVVASAGNDSDSHFITGSPATSPRVISVASSADATDILDGFRVNPPSTFAGEYAASFSVAYTWTTQLPVTATLVYPPTQRSGCQPFNDANKALIAGKIVLLDWTEGAGTCGSTVRGANLVAAGAVGGILADNSEVFDLFITGSRIIPMVSTPKSVGDTLKQALVAGPVSVTLSNEYLSRLEYTDPRLIDTLSTFSSRGPRRNGSILKPDIAAPGQGIFSVDGSLGGQGANQGANISGTSMAAPHVAGAMALMRQLHPTWTVDELKALVMNTAINNIRSDLPASAALLPPSRVGAGRIDLPRAAGSDVIAYNYGGLGLVSVTFGDVEVFGNATMTRKIRVFNKGAASVTYNLAYVPVTTIPGVTYTLSAPTITVAAGQVADVTVTMTANAADMRHTHDPALSEEQQGLARPWLSEASGYVVMTQSGLTTSNFTALINGSQENPPTPSAVTATGVFTYTGGNIQYNINFTQPITLTQAHFHRGPAGQNGPVAVAIPTGDNTFGPGDPLFGTVALTAPDQALLLQGGLYVNFHTTAHPTGEIRGQVVPSLAETTLRVPVYATARPASDMRAATTTLNFSPAPNLTATIPLTGTGINTGGNYPVDVVSLVSAFELQYTSPNEPESDELNDKADLAYVGVASDVASTSAFTETFIYFGIATHDDWSTPNEVEFNVYIDTNRDGVDDFVLFNSNLGWMTGGDQNDIQLTFLYDLQADELVDAIDYLNGVSPEDRDTAVFNNNVIVLPVGAADLGLTSANSRFNYHVRTLSLDDPGNEEGFSGAIEGQVDQTSTLTFNAAQPGLDTSGGEEGAPVYEDLPGRTISVKYNPATFLQSGSQGLLLFHHHNRMGDRVEVLELQGTRLYLPIIMR